MGLGTLPLFIQVSTDNFPVSSVSTELLNITKGILKYLAVSLKKWIALNNRPQKNPWSFTQSKRIVVMALTQLLTDYLQTKSRIAIIMLNNYYTVTTNPRRNLVSKICISTDIHFGS